ncbi:MAG: hypothetical protein IJH50_04950 [Kiritimatiellae bacterium]|nr:hypothetical protein [Kiritimatiellia bacterium]
MKSFLFANNVSKGWTCFVRVCMAVSCALAIAGCSMDSAELGEYVRKEMQEELVKNDVFKDLKMTSVRLIKTEGIEYAGVGKGDIGGYQVKFDVKCKYDGKTVIWDASLVDDNMLTLAGATAGKALREKVKAAWPGIKKGISEKYAAASEKMGEYFDTAKQKASELLDGAKEKVQKAVNKDEQDNRSL